MKQSSNPLSWEELSKLVSPEINRIEGPNNAYASLRLFGNPEEKVRVTLYRDHHAWCPYCQKVWLWLEWKQIPYRVKKVTMRCYGRKESWYLKKVPSGMLPAIEIDNKLVTESDEILLMLEKAYGPLGTSLEDKNILNLRNLERQLFRAWCIWLCNPSKNEHQEDRRQEQFHLLALRLEECLQKSAEPFLDPVNERSDKCHPGTGDVIFIPYIERMNASLAYYKGLTLRGKYPLIDKWLQALERLEVYRGTQGDFHTHSHDLPPQMGGCWPNHTPNQKKLAHLIDIGDGLGELECCLSLERAFSPEAVALQRVLKHKNKIMEINPLSNDLLDQPLRAALTNMVSETKECIPDRNTALGLRYIKDRISVPRDMPLLSARKLRQALETTAQRDSSMQGPPISVQNRFDQNPEQFTEN
tara:strand:- start:8346 stop:9590 length:1245 start_codon:yes stop_codon:yes gene_type:complete